MEDKELTKCPFCDSSDVGSEVTLFGKASADMCYSCGSTGPLKRTQKMADEAWNTRPLPWIEIKSEDDLPEAFKGLNHTDDFAVLYKCGAWAKGFYELCFAPCHRQCRQRRYKGRRRPQHQQSR